MLGIDSEPDDRTVQRRGTQIGGRVPADGAFHVVPPTVNGAVSTMTNVFSQSLGAFSKGFHRFAFDSGSVHACAGGGLSIPIAGELYTHKTPIPGCSAQ